jgi:hypothetical protein
LAIDWSVPFDALDGVTQHLDKTLLDAEATRAVMLHSAACFPQRFAAARVIVLLWRLHLQVVTYKH